jgi:hypothetical protein
VVAIIYMAQSAHDTLHSASRNGISYINLGLWNKVECLTVTVSGRGEIRSGKFGNKSNRQS